MAIESALLGPWATGISSIMNFIQLLIGGFFGFYVITFIYRVVQTRKLHKKADLILSEVRGLKSRVAKLEKKR